MARAAAAAAAAVVIKGMPRRTAPERILPSSVFQPVLVGVLIMSWSLPSAMRSRTWPRRPEAILGRMVQGTPLARRWSPVPCEAKMVKPRDWSWRAGAWTFLRSASRTEMKTLPQVGRDAPEAICDLAKAISKVRSAPMTSPVERISGPRTTSTPGNLEKGKTTSLTEK